MQNDTITKLEVVDPIAHPHYPQRIPHSARRRYTVITEEFNGNLTEDVEGEESARVG